MSAEFIRQHDALDVFLTRSQCLEGLNRGRAMAFRPVMGAAIERINRFFDLTIHQGDRSLAAPFLHAGLDPLGLLPPEGSCVIAMVFGTKHREELLSHLALASDCLVEGGLLLVTVANELGADSMERRIKEALGSCEAFSKQKCRVLSVLKNSSARSDGLLASWRSLGQLRPLGETGLFSGPGIFSWKSPDPGSCLLAEFFPRDLEGRGADLGAGYGFLTQALIRRNPGVKAVSLIEVEKKAIEAARLGQLADAPKAEWPSLLFDWRDVTQGTGLKNLDFVVTNPPFHQGRGASTRLGQRFIEEGLRALRPGGRFLMVANCQLPYEETLARAGGEVIRAEAKAGFKLLEARRAS